MNLDIDPKFETVSFYKDEIGKIVSYYNSKDWKKSYAFYYQSDWLPKENSYPKKEAAEIAVKKGRAIDY